MAPPVRSSVVSWATMNVPPVLVPPAAFWSVPVSTLMVPLLSNAILTSVEVPVPPVFFSVPSLVKVPDQPPSPRLASAAKSNRVPAGLSNDVPLAKFIPPVPVTLIVPWLVSVPPPDSAMAAPAGLDKVRTPVLVSVWPVDVQVAAAPLEHACGEVERGAAGEDALPPPECQRAVARCGVVALVVDGAAARQVECRPLGDDEAAARAGPAGGVQQSARSHVDERRVARRRLVREGDSLHSGNSPRDRFFPAAFVAERAAPARVVGACVGLEVERGADLVVQQRAVAEPDSAGPHDIDRPLVRDRAAANQRDACARGLPRS